MLGGCASKRSDPHLAYTTGNRDTAIDELKTKAAEPDKDQALDQLRLASMTLATGDHRTAEQALRGAVMLLLSQRKRAELDQLIGRIEHVELETEADFFDLFVDGCQFMPLAA